MILYVRPEGNIFESYTYEGGIKRFKMFSDDLYQVFTFAQNQGFKPMLRVEGRLYAKT